MQKHVTATVSRKLIIKTIIILLRQLKVKKNQTRPKLI